MQNHGRAEVVALQLPLAHPLSYAPVQLSTKAMPVKAVVKPLVQSVQLGLAKVMEPPAEYWPRGQAAQAEPPLPAPQMATAVDW